MTARVAPRVLIGAAGTGGHVYPGLALARAIADRAPGASVVLVGGRGGLESRAVPAAGLQLATLPVLPLARRLTLRNLLAPFAAVWSTVVARRLVRRNRADVVVGMGGYVTLPLAAGARLAGVPVVLHEQNAVPGLANRLAARFATQVGLALPVRAGAFGRVPTELVGLPVRAELRGLDRTALRAEAAARFGLDARLPTLLVFGGSQGASRINRAIVAATPSWPAPASMQILHLCGGRDEGAITRAWREAAPERRGLTVQLVGFVERMDLAYAIADLALTRAGASTVAELELAGVPAVLVPLPHATAGHQAANAQALAAGGAALVVPDATLDGDRLAAAVSPLLGDAARLGGMAAAMRRLARPDAADRLAELVLAAVLPQPDPVRGGAS